MPINKHALFKGGMHVNNIYICNTNCNQSSCDSGQKSFKKMFFQKKIYKINVPVQRIPLCSNFRHHVFCAT